MWAELPMDLLEMVAERLICHLDFFHFGHVCVFWRLVAMKNHTRLPLHFPLCYCIPWKNPPPVLILPSSRDDSEYCDFFSIFEKKHVGSLGLPETRGKWSCASMNGWLLMVDLVEEPEEVSLFNPLNRKQIPLPPVSTFPNRLLLLNSEPTYYFFIRKAILCSGPSACPKDWMIFVVVSNARRIFYCRSGDESWTMFGNPQSSICPTPELHMDDILFHKGKIFGVNSSGYISFFNICDTYSKSHPPMTLIAKPPFRMTTFNSQKYLVEFKGEVLMVVRLYAYADDEADPRGYWTSGFRIYMVVEKGGRYELVELHSLDGGILLIGRNNTIFLSGRDIGLSPNCIGNCIYFTDDFCHPYIWGPDDDRCHDAGIFNLEDRSIIPYDAVDLCCYFMPPLWLRPSFKQALA